MNNLREALQIVKIQYDDEQEKELVESSLQAKLQSTELKLAMLQG